MNYETITCSVEDHVAIITMNRPDNLNALSQKLLIEVEQAFDAAAADDEVRAVLFTGAGRGFSSGADLGDSAGMPISKDGKLDLGLSLRNHYNPIVQKMRAMPKPIIGAVNGIAAGAGCSLALNCDITIAGRSSQFLLAFVNIALIPDAGATWVIPRRVGNQRAMGMSMLGDKLPAEKALQWGLIWDVVDDEVLADTAMDMAKKLASGPTLALARIKQSTYAAADNDLATQLEMEAVLQKDCGRSDDFMEGVQAFMQKRPARFKGK